MQAVISKNYKLTNPEISENGRWAIVRKKYAANSDTLMVFNTGKIANITAILVNKKPYFMQKDFMLTFGGHSAEFWDLRTKKKMIYENVKAAGSLYSHQYYVIQNHDKILTVHDTAGKTIHRITNVQGIFTSDGDRRLYVIRENGDKNEIIELLGNRIACVYSTKNEVNKIELTPSGKQLIVKEVSDGAGKILFFDTLRRQIKEISTISFKEPAINVSEIQNGVAYLIRYSRSTYSADKMLVDIWYGNDNNLERKKFGTTEYTYWMYYPDSGQVINIPPSKLYNYTAFNNSRYLIAFKPTRVFNYEKLTPDTEIEFYDVRNGSYSEKARLKGLRNGASEIISSADGRYFLSSLDGENWCLFDAETMQQTLIHQTGLGKPFFDQSGTFILFENKSDLWKYEIKPKILSPSGLAPGKAVKIITGNTLHWFDGYNFSTNTVESRKPILLQISDTLLNKTSYLILNKGMTKKLHPKEGLTIGELASNRTLQKVITLEENYKNAPQVYFNDLEKKIKRPLSTPQLASSFNSKKEIINYINSEGKALRGILYYPVNCSSDKKYPMVVRIYQIQSSKPDQYLMPSENADGFNIRVLLERGYFVYLPDIIYNGSGTGLSALECVDNALDAVRRNPNIDMKKIGLMGHSHGGYETNFIATHSSRFTAYISGAGNSDIVRSYFSYNYNFTSPFYWQYENGQYEMKAPFGKDKDLYFKNNPIYNVDQVNAPILLWAGKNDENIVWDQVMEFYIGLRRNNKNVIALFYPRSGHDLGRNSEESKDLSRRVLQWWDYFLKDKKEVDWIERQIRN